VRNGSDPRDQGRQTSDSGVDLQRRHMAVVVLRRRGMAVNLSQWRASGQRPVMPDTVAAVARRQLFVLLGRTDCTPWAAVMGHWHRVP